MGFILAMAAGIYIHVATVVSLPNALKHEKDEADENTVQVIPKEGSAPIDAAIGKKSASVQQAKVLVAFIIGAIAIGLILLDHEHCEEGHGDEHEGHGHRKLAVFLNSR